MKKCSINQGNIFMGTGYGLRHFQMNYYPYLNYYRNMSFLNDAPYYSRYGKCNNRYFSMGNYERFFGVGVYGRIVSGFSNFNER